MGKQLSKDEMKKLYASVSTQEYGESGFWEKLGKVSFFQGTKDVVGVNKSMNPRRLFTRSVTINPDLNPRLEDSDEAD